MPPPGSFAPDQPPPRKGPAGPPSAGGWRTDAPAAGGRWVAAAALLVLISAIAAVIVWLVFFSPKPRPEWALVVSLPVEQYSDPAWPVVPWASQDADLILVAARSDQKLSSFQVADRIDEVRKWLRGESTGLEPLVPNRPLVLHVTALAVTDGPEVYLLSAHADPLDRSKWVPVKDLLDAMQNAVPTHRMMILDLAHPVADPFNGVLTDDVAQKLHDLLEQKKLSYPVLTSCSPGELSLPAMASSGFAKFVAAGLRGVVNGDGETEEPVTPEKLAAFVRDQVPKWANRVHGRHQTPKLYGPLQAFDITRPKPGAVQAEQPAEPAKYPDWLTKGWKLRDDAKKDETYRTRPVAFAQLTAGLLRAERLWAGGDTGRDGRAGRDKEGCDKALLDWNRSGPGSGGGEPAADTYSQRLGVVAKFRLAAALGPRSDLKKDPKSPDWRGLLDPYVKSRSEPSAKADENAKKEWQKAASDNKLAAAWAIFERAATGPAPTKSDLKEWAEVTKDLALTDEYVELVLLAGLAEGTFYRNRPGLAFGLEFPGEAVAAVLRAEYEFSKAVAAGPEGLPLVRGRFTAAEQRRRDGWQNLLKAKDGTEAALAAKDLRAAAEDLAPAAGTVTEMLAEWRECHRELGAAAVALHDTLPAAVEYGDPVFEAWRSEAEAAIALADVVTRGHAGDFNKDDAKEKREDLNRKRAALDRKPNEDLKPLRAREPMPDEVARLKVLLAGTTLPAESRQDADFIVRKELTNREAKADSPAAAAPKPWDLAGLRDRRMQASVLLLKFAGYPEADALASGPGRRLAEAWRSGLPSHAEAAAARKEWHVVERVARAVPPGALSTDAPPDALDATRNRANADADAYAAALTIRLQADAKAAGFPDDAQKFYQRVLNDWQYK